ncbi:ABC transporter substrate-binding protein [Aestuariimicrobium soli]|uniref:ABC transporter substrate-binding protein n=1 Tax=Aestuariimicrobium soli TaxID=2035834 RepID=UPI003EC0AE60
MITTNPVLPDPAKLTTLSRRTLLAGIGATAAATALAACSSDETPASTDGKLSGSINVWGGVPPENGPQELVDAFMKANPGTTVTYTRFVNDDQGNLKLDTGLQGGSDIDVFTTYSMPLLAQRVGAGLAADLSDKIAGVKEFAPYAANADPVQNFTHDGKVYGIPAQTSPTTVLANLDMFEKAGITPPESWSFDEYRDVAKKLSQGNVKGSFNAPPSARATLGPDAYYAADGKSSNFRNEAFRQEIQRNLDMSNEGSAMDMKTILAEKLQVYTQGPFLQGRVGMITSQLFLVRYISNLKEFPHDFKTIALPQPGPSASDDGWNTGAVGDILSVNSKSKNPDLAWALIEFWMKNAAKYMTKGGRLPSLAGDETPDSLLGQLLGADAEKIYDVASFKKMLFERKNKIIVDTKFAAAAQITQIMTQLSQEVLLGTRPVDSYIDELAKQADAAIGKAS